LPGPPAVLPQVPGAQPMEVPAANASLKNPFDALPPEGTQLPATGPSPLTGGSAADPFDPEVFNRRFGTSAPLAPELPAAAEPQKVPPPSPFFAK
ncbi:MAG: hypothetical protein ACYC6Y_26570, partial [Thermoguttaceae bacterium]